MLLELWHNSEFLVHSFAYCLLPTAYCLLNNRARKSTHQRINKSTSHKAYLLKEVIFLPEFTGLRFRPTERCSGSRNSFPSLSPGRQVHLKRGVFWVDSTYTLRVNVPPFSQREPAPPAAGVSQASEKNAGAPILYYCPYYGPPRPDAHFVRTGHPSLEGGEGLRHK